ncbi:hypothetical protein C8R43DRAFT_878291, partial [Mycena crocata]
PVPHILAPDIKDVSVRRDFMTVYYGGSKQSTFPPVAEEKYTITGHRYFMYPSPVQNPDAQMVPGAPGLFFDATGWPATECHVEWTTKTYKVLSRLCKHNFLYMGEYDITPADPLTLEEWNAQTHSMQNIWCTRLATKGWGRVIRTRIGLRRLLARNPTLKEVETAIKGDEEYLYITANDVAAGFSNEEEVPLTVSMKCVGYDEQFQRDLVRQLADWVPPQK